MSKGNLKFIFDQGRGRIFWGEDELTTGLSVYTSVRSLGSWFDSYQADWEITQRDKNKIIVLGSWPYIPISQTWQVELIDKDSILWRVDVDIYEEVDLEIEQANIMLSSEYKNWIVTNVITGKFLNEYTRDYDILPFRFWYGLPEKREIGVLDDILPSVLFKCNLQEQSFRAIVENTDYLYKARLIQYQKCNTIKLLPKKYRYFEGVIKIAV